MYHGFLAVDFFFILSGFVMGYAYDTRWDVMSMRNFVCRRIIRLHPMVLMSVVLGALAYRWQGNVMWDGTLVPVTILMWATLLALFLIPAPSGFDVRGNTEIFSLNGPLWSLFFEYIGSWLYALLLHRLSTRWLSLWVAVAFSALALNGWLQGEGWIAYGWSVQPDNLWGGMLRLMYGYPAGLLLARLYSEKKPSPIKAPMFLICSVALVLLLAVPNLGVASLPYQLLCVGLFFPIIIWHGCRGVVKNKATAFVLWLGRVSYPLYTIHYPLIYLYISWISVDSYPLGLTATTCPIAVFAIAIVLAWLIMFIYDEPIRKHLSKKMLSG